MGTSPPNERINLLNTLRTGASFIGTALSQLGTRRKEPQMPPPPAGRPPAPDGPRWGPLVLLDKVGEGAFGEVYRAWDVTLEREVALKLMRAAAEDPALLQEARMLARLRHLNIVTVYGADRHEGRSGVWMDFIEGDTLAALVEERGSFGAREALLMGVDVCRALAAAHQRGLLHRDIKAQNVMRERGGRIVLMDFGLGHEAGVVAADFGGTPLYMAPELFQGGPPTVRSDLYAAGVLLYHLVTGDYPVKGSTVDELRAAHIAQTPRTLRDLRSDLPSSFVRVVERALAAEPPRRYGSAGQMTAALEAALGTRRFPPVLSRRAFWPMASSLAALAAAAGWYRWRRPTAAVKRGASLLLSDISNTTGDAQLNAMADVLRVQLAQSAHFSLLEGDRVRETLQQMTKSPDQKLDLSLAREVALRSATPLVVYGTVSPLGAGYGLSLVVERIEGQPRTPLTTESKLFEARNKTGLFDAIHQAATWIRQTAGEAAQDISANDTQPEEATTSSWEALDYFAKGERLLTPARTGDAVTMYKQATRVDPGFSLALARIAQGQSFLQHKSEAFEYWRKAVEALDQRHVTRREDFRIRGMHAIATEDYAAAEQSTRMFTILYPRDSKARHYHGEALRNLDRLEEAYREFRTSQGLHPTEVTLNNLVAVGLELGKQQDVAAYLSKMKPAAAGYLGSLAKFLNQDYAGCDVDLLAVIRGDDARLRSAAYGARASLLGELGRLREARGVLEQGVVADVATGNLAGRARKLLALAHLQLSGSDKGSARGSALEAALHDGDTACLWRVGSLLARAGFPADARKVLARISSPDEGRRVDTARTIVAAEIALAERRMEEALREFAKADQLVPPIHPRDFLARALESAGRADEALAAWRRIAERPALVWESEPDLHPPGTWTEALVRVAGLSLQLGRPASGRAALALVLKTQEHADADLPQFAVVQKLLKQYQP